MRDAPFLTVPDTISGAGNCPSDSLVESTGNNVSLLLRSELDKVHRIAGHADCKLRIVLRMCLSIQ